MDEKEIKGALDAFERDDFVTAKEILSTQIKNTKNDYLKNKLGLVNDIEPKPVVPDDPIIDKKHGRKKDGLK